MRNARLWIILGITFMFAVGMSIVFPLFPFLVEKVLPPSQVVAGLSVLISAYAVCQFFAAPIFGALSDRFGRRPILIASLIGSVGGYLMLGVGGSFWMLLLGRVIDGITAGDITALFAYITDSTDESERTKWFSLIGASIGLGMMIGPALGGLLGSVSLSLPFFATAGVFLFISVCTFFFLPESLEPSRRATSFQLSQLNVFAHFKEVFRLKNVRAPLLIGAFFYLGLGLYQVNLGIFLKDDFAWGPKAIGSILTLVGICDIFSRSLILPRVLGKFKETAIRTFGLCLLALGLVQVSLSAFTGASWLILSAVACITLGEGLFEPPYMTLLTTSVDENKQGLVQGVSQSLQSSYRALVPLAAGGLYYIGHSMVYVVAAGLILVAFTLTVRTGS